MLTGEYKDPNTNFIVDDESGIYLTSVELYFNEKPDEDDEDSQPVVSLHS